MKKMKTVFIIDRTTNRAINDVTPECRWVIDGEGVAARKFDGTSSMIEDGVLFRRYDAKPGRVPPAGFIPCMSEPDPVTGHNPGWLPCDRNAAADRFHFEAFDRLAVRENGTYELVGPKVQGNRDHFSEMTLVRHGRDVLEDFPRTFAGMREYLEAHEIEGVGFHHPDGRMAKVRRKDFGIRW